MTSRRQPLIPLVLSSLVFLLSACDSELECKTETSIRLMVAAEESCPSVDDAPAKIADAYHTEDEPEIIDLWGRAFELDAQTICWYLEAVQTSDDQQFWQMVCPVLESREQRLADATGGRPTWLGFGDAGPEYVEACDAEGRPLFGYVLHVPLDDEHQASSIVAAECPAKLDPFVTTSGVEITPTTLIGSDLYPARAQCDYQVAEAAPCSSGSFPSFGLM